MARDLLFVAVNRLSIVVKVSDQWQENGKPIRFRFRDPGMKGFVFARSLVFLWFAVWIAIDEKEAGHAAG